MLGVRQPGAAMTREERGISTTTRRAALIGGLTAGLILTACQGTALPEPTASPPARTPTGTPAPTPQGLEACPAAAPLASLAVIAHTDINPDDLLALPDGTLWVSDPDSGRLEHLAADGQVLQRISDPEAPEGMVAVSAGIVLAEQRTNRLVRFTPPATARTTLLSLPASQGAEGIDGVGAGGAGLLIPDSPRGSLFTSAVDGSGEQLVATGLGRDVGATVGPDGAVWVAVEGDRGLLRVPAGGGAATPVGGSDLTQLDDIASLGALLYATSLTTDDVVAIDPANGADRLLVTGGHSLQGLAVLPDGRLAVADSVSRLIATVAPC